MFRTGWTTPVSLFASMTETIAVGVRNASSESARSITPFEPTFSLRTFHPERARSSAGFITQGCSIAEIAACVGFRQAAAPRMNKLLASVPPETNTTWEGCTPTRLATCSRARSIALRARVP